MVSQTESLKIRSAAKDFARLWSLARGEPMLLTAALIALAVGAGVNLSLPAILRYFIDDPKVWQSWIAAIQVVGIVIFLFAFQAVCFYCRSLFFSLLGQRATSVVRERLFSVIMERPIEFFDTSRVGDLVSRLIADTSLLQDAISLRMSVVIRYGLQVVVGTALMVLLSWKLAIGILAIVPVLVAVSRYFGGKLRAASRELQEELGRASQVGEEAFSGIRIVRAFAAEQIERGRFARHAHDFLSIGSRRAKIAAFFSSFVSFLLNAVLTVVVLIGILSVQSGALTTGELTAFLLYGAIVGTSFALLVSAYSELLQAFGGVSRVFDILDSSAINGKDWSQPKKPIKGDISFKNVSFSYPSRPKDKVLRGVSLDLKAGRTTSIIGYSGAGKSSIVNLALKFYEPTEGEILFDSEPLSKLDPSSIRRLIGLVPQELLLFNTTLLENIRYGSPHASIDDVRRVCRDVGLLDFIEELPKGLNTEVGTRGVQLSGGQRQRVALARALLKDAPILILDEATSALDADSEKQFHETLARVSKGKTTLIISHRLASVQNADWIYVLEDGAIVAQGTHGSLLEEKGIYAHLVRLQTLRAASQ